MKANTDKVIVIATGDKAPDSHVALYIMKKFGLDKVLVETSYYMHYLVSQKLMDELFFNYSCIYVGGQAISCFPGKSEQWLLVSSHDDCTMFFGGQGEKPVAMERIFKI